MLPLSYTISSDLRTLLLSVDALRNKILTTPLSPATEHTLRWEATVARIAGSLALANIKLTKTDIAKALIRGQKTKPSVVIGYKRALNVIQDVWTASAQTPTVATITSLADMVYVGPFISYKRTFEPSGKPIRQLLTYLENQTEHPVIQAGVALGILSGAILPPEHPGLIARLTAVLFLAKDGFDLRGMSGIEHEWASEAPSYHVALSSIAIQQNLNHWLLFFTESVESNFRKLAQTITVPLGRPTHSVKLWSLNERQRAILHLLDDPGAVITNRIVQKHFKISQITSSRDLAKLASVGLLIPHGKGRSVSYTRI